MHLPDMTPYVEIRPTCPPVTHPRTLRKVRVAPIGLFCTACLLSDQHMSLFAPVVRQVLGQSQESRRRELDRLTALKQRAHNIRRQIGQSNEGGWPALVHSEASAHRLDAVVRSCRSFASIDRVMGSISGLWLPPPASSAAAIFARFSQMSIRLAAMVGVDRAADGGPGSCEISLRHRPLPRLSENPAAA